MKVIRLECKSIKQLERTCAELESLGVTSFCLSAKAQSVGAQRGVTFCLDKTYTCGLQGDCALGDEKYYKRKEFIAAVKRALGESK